MPADEINREEAPRDRRDLFRLGLSRLVRPVADYVAQRIDLSEPKLVLRPPGALPEKAFLDTCYRCGSCVSACPVSAIKPMGGSNTELKDTPTIDPGVTACVACERVECTRVCPSGALQLLTDARLIRMGLARVDDGLCLLGKGEDCSECIDRCPMGSEALILNERGFIEVLEAGCVGCGVCQQYCPTSPKAIVVHKF